MTVAPDYADLAHRCKYVFFAALFVLLFLGTYYPALAMRPMFQLLASGAVGVLAMIWARLDAQARSLELPLPLAVGMVLLAGVFVPFWLFHSRTPLEAGVAIVRFLLWTLLLVMAFTMGVVVLEQRGIVPVLPATAG